MFTFIGGVWVLSNIETILFDKDGTFVDLHYFWGKMTKMRASAVIKKYSLSEDDMEKICKILGYDIQKRKMLSDGITALYSRSRIIEIFTEKLIEIGVNAVKYEIEKLFDEVSEEFNKNILDYILPIEDSIEFIRELRSKGAKMGVVTSDSEESTYLTLKGFGWEDLFDVVVGRESSSETKESGALTKIALEKLGANPTTTLMIGDAPMDAISAQNAGVEKTILLTTGQVDAETLEDYSPYVLKSLKRLKILKY